MEAGVRGHVDDTPEREIGARRFWRAPAQLGLPVSEWLMRWDRIGRAWTS